MLELYIELWKSAWKDMGDDWLGKGLMITSASYYGAAAIAIVVVGFTS